jgi:putative DNA primase/helicase
MNGLKGPISLFFLTLAMSGDRKSTADGRFTAAISQYENEQAAKFAPEITAYRKKEAAWNARNKGILAGIEAASKGRPSKGGKSIEDLQKELHAIEADRPIEPRVPCLLRGDDTSEHLAWSLAYKWPCVAIISSEAGVVFGGHAKGPDAIMRNLALQNTLWDGREHKVGRRTSESFTMRGARLTIGLQVQEEALRDFCKKNGTLARGMGYFARFLFSQPRSMQGEREITGEPPRTQPAIAAFNRMISGCLNTPVNFDEGGVLSPMLLGMSSEGKAAWIELHNGIERELKPDGELRDIRDVASKAPDNIARLAGIFHVTEHGVIGSIGADCVRRAGEIAIWHLNEAQRFLGEFSMPTELAGAARLEGWLIERCGKGDTKIVPRRDVQRFGPSGLRDKKALTEALAELQELGRAREVKNGSSREIHVHPAVLSGDAP